MKKTILSIELFAFIVSLLWLYYQPGYEPLLALLVIITSIITTYFVKSENKLVTIPLDIRTTSYEDPSINKNNKYQLDELQSQSRSNESIDVKLNKRILFIDDEKFLLVGILKKAGWINTKVIKDVIDLDNNDVKAADIIFVDINGVGKTLYPKDQGLGLAAALKTLYPKKAIVVYSAESQRVHKAYSIVDACLPKDADPYEFIELINDFSKN